MVIFVAVIVVIVALFVVPIIGVVIVVIVIVADDIAIYATVEKCKWIVDVASVVMLLL